MIQACIARLACREDLSEDEAFGAVSEIMRGEATPAQIGAFLMGLRAKGETVPEITGAARSLREHGCTIRPAVAGPLVDTCGTGGDGRGTFNVSTAAALVVAGDGAPVAKHGNRSVSSRAGSADVLEALGVAIDLPPAQVQACIEEVGIGFLFAPRFHPAMRHAAAPRRELGIRTLFNLLGPLANPAGAEVQVVGVFDRALVEPVAEVFLRLGTREAWVVHSLDGLDEISPCAPSWIARVAGGRIQVGLFEPEEAGLERADPVSLQGGDARENAFLLEGVLRGGGGGVRSAVLLNAAAALMAAGRADGWKEGVARAARSIDRGHALERLAALRAFTRRALEEASA